MGKFHGNRDVKKEHYKLGAALDEKKKIEILKEVFRERVGYELNLDNPRSMNEKIMWLKLYYQNPLITRCCDKYAVKEYARDTIGDGYTVRTIASWNSADEIDFDVLPERFVLKVNWSSGYNIIVKNKENADFDAIKKQICEWMKPEKNSYYQFFNWGYKHMKPVVYAEEYLDQIDGQVYDYKFFMCGGKMRYMLIATDRGNDANLTHDFFDNEFNNLPFFYGGLKHANPLPSKPRNFEKMIILAEKLAKPFPFVRVDFYELGKDVYLGEMTFYPAGGVYRFVPEEWDFILGRNIVLPQKMITDKEDILFKCRNIAKNVEILGKNFFKGIVWKERKEEDTFIRVLGVRVPYKTHVEIEDGKNVHWVRVFGLEIKYRKTVYIGKSHIDDNSEVTYIYENNKPKENYILERMVSNDVKQIHCEQKAYSQLGYFPDLINPKSLNEKIIWLALHYKNPEIGIAADKAKAKKWISERIGEEYVIPIIKTYDNIQDLNIHELPTQFVAKLNDGWGAEEVLVVRDKNALDIDETKAILSSWLYPWKNYYYQNMCITDEKLEKPQIVIEEYREQKGKTSLNDYKLYCCNGKPKFALVVNGRGTSEQERSFVDTDWNVLPVTREGKPLNRNPDKPQKLEEMIRLSEKLADGFPFVRIDFYEVGNRIYVGELTFTPGMFLKFEPRAWDYKLGDYLDISYLMT